MTIIARTIFNPGTERQVEVVWKETAYADLAGKGTRQHYVQVYRGDRLEYDYILQDRESASQVYLTQVQTHAPS